jgi:hypothetical protein
MLSLYQIYNKEVRPNGLFTYQNNMVLIFDLVHSYHLPIY